jgi:hypothetical protein
MSFSIRLRADSQQYIRAMSEHESAARVGVVRHPHVATNVLFEYKHVAVACGEHPGAGDVRRWRFWPSIHHLILPHQVLLADRDCRQSLSF